MSCEISVIIPVYNTEKYLKRCLDSVIHQTFKDIEIIIVNDGSTDNSSSIIDKYKNKDSRIIVINQDNNGLSEARNSGIKVSSGKYISFVDSDDTISLDMLNIVHKQLIKENSELIIFRYQRLSNETEIVLYRDIDYENMTKEEIFRLSVSLKIIPVSWNKVYKRSLFIDNNLYFPKNMYFEDCALIFKLIYFAKKVSFLNKILYNWYDIEGSITNSISEKHIYDRIKLLLTIKDFLQKYEIYKIYQKEYLFSIVQTLYKIEYSLKFEKNIEKKSKLFNTLNALIQDNNIMLKKEKRKIIEINHPLYYMILCKFLRNSEHYNMDFLFSFYEKKLINSTKKTVHSKLGLATNLIIQASTIKNCYVYGAGELFDKIYPELIKNNIAILGIFDKNAENYNYEKFGIKIQTIQNIFLENNSNIIVASIDFAQSITEFLDEYSNMKDLKLNIINYYSGILNVKNTLKKLEEYS